MFVGFKYTLKSAKILLPSPEENKVLEILNWNFLLNMAENLYGEVKWALDKRNPHSLTEVDFMKKV